MTEKIYEFTLRAIRTKFKVDASDWLKDLTEEQLEEVYDSVINDLSYEDIKGKYCIREV